MPIATPTRLKKAADKAGISVGGHDGSPSPTLQQLAIFAQEFQKISADKCLAIAHKHHKTPGSRASALKAGALECFEALAVKRKIDPDAIATMAKLMDMHSKSAK